MKITIPVEFTTDTSCRFCGHKGPVMLGPEGWQCTDGIDCLMRQPAEDPSC